MNVCSVVAYILFWSGIENQIQFFLLFCLLSLSSHFKNHDSPLKFIYMYYLRLMKEHLYLN